MNDRATSDQERLARYVEIWKRACTDFVALAREIPEEQWHLPTDLDGWDVKDNVAHTAHLESVLAGAPEETIEVAPAPHLKSLTAFYTEQGVLARREVAMTALADEIERSVTTRAAALASDPPTDGKAMPARTPGGAPWNCETVLSNRPLDVWMHEQDIRRAIGRPGGFDSPAAAHVIRVFSRALPMVLGKRVAPPAGTSVVLKVPAAGLAAGAVIGADGRAASVTDPDRPNATISLTPEAFVVLAGGRRTPERVDAQVSGDQELGRAVLNSLAVTP